MFAPSQSDAERACDGFAAEVQAEGIVEKRILEHSLERLVMIREHAGASRQVVLVTNPVLWSEATQGGWGVSHPMHEMP